MGPGQNSARSRNQSIRAQTVRHAEELYGVNSRCLHQSAVRAQELFLKPFAGKPYSPAFKLKRVRMRLQVAADLVTIGENCAHHFRITFNELAGQKERRLYVIFAQGAEQLAGSFHGLRLIALAAQSLAAGMSIESEKYAVPGRKQVTVAGADAAVVS